MGLRNVWLKILLSPQVADTLPCMLDLEWLDEFHEYWNNHHILKQKHKILPMGTSPHHMWLVPDSVCVTSHNCSIHVDMNTVHQLREDLGGAEGHDQAF